MLAYLLIHSSMPLQLTLDEKSQWMFLNKVMIREESEEMDLVQVIALPVVLVARRYSTIVG